MYYNNNDSNNDNEYKDLFMRYKVADKLQTSIGLNVSDKNKDKILSFNWDIIKNDSIKNTELYEFNDMTKIFIRPHFDIDYEWKSINYKLANDIKENAISKILDHFNIDINDISIAQNHRNDKCSFHFVITNLMTTMESLSKWVEEFKQELLIDHFDLSIYRNGFNKWRMLNTIKRINKKKNNDSINENDLLIFKKETKHDDIDFLITYTNPDIMKLVIYINEILDDEHNLNDIRSNTYSDYKSNLNENEIIEILNLINSNQVDNYNDTIKFIWSCVSSKSNIIINKCRDICKLNKKYYDDETWFDSIVEIYDINSNITISSALNMAKESNPNQFKLITQKYKSSNSEEYKLLYDAINTNYDYAIAKYYCFKYPNNILVYKGNTYYYKKGFWKFIDDNNYSIKKVLATEFYDIFNKLLNKKFIESSKIKNSELEDDKNRLKELKIQINNLNKICYKLQTSGSKEAIIKEIYIASSHDNIVFDEHKHLLNFNNGTLNLNTKEFYKHNPFDYITKIIPYDYNPSKYTNTNKEEFINKISSIFPSREELNYLLWRISYCFYGGNQLQESVFWIGEGRNGKGILSDLVSTVFGTYFNVLTISYMTTYDKNSNAPNAELLKLKGCRLVVINEADNTSPLNTIKFKSLTGNDTISARDLHSKSTQFEYFKPQFTPFILTNSSPTFTKLDDAVIARLSIINFPFYFGTIGDGKYDHNNPNHKIRNNNLFNELLINIDVFLHILLDYYFGNKIDKPISVNEYQKKLLLEINTVASFCIDNLEDSENSRVGVSDLYDLYKNSNYNLNNMSPKAFTDKIKSIFASNFTDKRLKINYKVQYVLNNKKLINQESDIIESDEEKL